MKGLPFFAGTVVATSVLTGAVVTKFYDDATLLAGSVTSAQINNLNVTEMTNETVTDSTSTRYDDSPLPDNVKIGIATTVCLIAGVTQVSKVVLHDLNNS